MSRSMGKQATLSECEEFHSIVYALMDFSERQDIDNAIPAFATALAMLGVRRGAEKKMFLSYVAGVLDRVYSGFENQETRNCSK